MIKNGKFFLAPPKDRSDFKELFKHMTSSGVGRLVDKDGFVDGPWTPDLLAEAISLIDANRAGIELRTVQLWFQNNEKGISSDNIRWLARVFGCDDPEATSDWQSALILAQARMKSKKQRRKDQKLEQVLVEPQLLQEVSTGAPDIPTVVLERPIEKGRIQGVNLARRSEACFGGQNPLNLPIAIWACGGVLWFLAYILGLHSVIYSPIDGVEKQVGLFWAPSWTMDRMLFVSVFLAVASGLVRYWKEQGRSQSTPRDARLGQSDDWLRTVDAFSFSYWLILLVCLAVVFFLQWICVYLPALKQGDVGSAMVDWILVAVERPEVVNLSEAIAISGFANLYSCFVYWSYFVGLLLLYTIAGDYRRILSHHGQNYGRGDCLSAHRVGERIMHSLYCCAVFGILSAACIKLNAVYLITDAENIITWLVDDALTALGLRDESWNWLDKSPSAFATSFLVLFVTCFVFFTCLAQIYRASDQLLIRLEAEQSSANFAVKEHAVTARASWRTMMAIIVLLSASSLGIGQFAGFSILLFGSVMISITSLISMMPKLSLYHYDRKEFSK